MLFRRVRDEHGVLHLSQRAKAYHPGQGVYRSSYKNARRLTSTETNIAYRTADHLHRQDLDFVVGIKVQLSNNHTLNGEPFVDICDHLQGDYPKDFKFVGWHPHCRCFVTNIFKTEEERREDLRRMLRGEAPIPAEQSKNYVADVPDAFKGWCRLNAGRVERAKSLPYFIKDNRGYYDSAFKPQLKEDTTILAPGASSSDVAKQRHANRSSTDVKDIKDRWRYRQSLIKGFSAEQLSNLKKLEVQLNIQRDMPMPFGLADKGHPNPQYTNIDAEQLGYYHNCQTCTVAFELRRRGFDVEAKANPIVHKMSVNGRTAYFREIDFWAANNNSTWEQRFFNPNGTTPTWIKSTGIKNTIEEKQKFIEGCASAQGRYEVYCRWNSDSAHVFILERQKNGNLVWYDPQSAKIDTFKEDYLQKMVYDDIRVLRIDDKLINPKFMSRLLKAK